MSKDRIELSIPSKAEYISLARLTTSGLAHQAKLNIDEIEDMKVCVGEACVNIINYTDEDTINIDYIIKDDKLEIKVENVNEGIGEEDEEARLGLLIIESLTDKVSIEKNVMTITKYIE